MDFAFLQTCARVTPVFRQQHAIKAAGACARLRQNIVEWNQDSKIWTHLENSLALEQETLAPFSFGDKITLAQPLTLQRAKHFVNNAIIPLAYSGIRTWVETDGLDDILKYYLDEVCGRPGYLGHNLSVLFGFVEAYPLFKESPELRSLFLDRLVEFLVVSFTVADKRNTVKIPPIPAPDLVTMEMAVELVTLTPGFFGHNVIHLSYIFANQTFLSVIQRNTSLLSLHQNVTAVYVDDEDNLTISDEGAFTELPNRALLLETLSALFQNPKRNLHIATLSDSVVRLWEICSPLQQFRLMKLLRLHIKV